MDGPEFILASEEYEQSGQRSLSGRIVRCKSHIPPHGASDEDAQSSLGQEVAYHLAQVLVDGKNFFRYPDGVLEVRAMLFTPEDISRIVFAAFKKGAQFSQDREEHVKKILAICARECGDRKDGGN